MLRYPSANGVDGLPPGEGVFLPCSFWLADNLAVMGRGDEAEQLFERLLALRNDAGLLAEEYDPRAKCMLGMLSAGAHARRARQPARNLTCPGAPS